MKKSLVVFLPNGDVDNFTEGKDNVDIIDIHNINHVCVTYKIKDGDTTVSLKRVYSGMPFVLSDV